jgi:hypothetical protein
MMEVFVRDDVKLLANIGYQFINKGWLANDGKIIYMHFKGTNEFVLMNFEVEGRVVGQVGETKIE